LTTLLVCTLVMILGTATLLTIGTLAEIMSEAYYRVPAVVAVLAILGMTLVPLVRAGRQAA
jgi:hypothetical protein